MTAEIAVLRKERIAPILKSMADNARLKYAGGRMFGVDIDIDDIETALALLWWATEEKERNASMASSHLEMIRTLGARR